MNRKEIKQWIEANCKEDIKDELAFLFDGETCILSSADDVDYLDDLTTAISKKDIDITLNIIEFKKCEECKILTFASLLIEYEDKILCPECFKKESTQKCICCDRSFKKDELILISEGLVCKECQSEYNFIIEPDFMSIAHAHKEDNLC